MLPTLLDGRRLIGQSFAAQLQILVLVLPAITTTTKELHQFPLGTLEILRLRTRAHGNSSLTTIAANNAEHWNKTALICHMSCSTIRKYFRDVVGVTISRGMLRKLVGKVSTSLSDPYEALCAMLPTEDRLNVDETGQKENGQRLWTWCFRAYLYVEHPYKKMA